MWRWNCKRKRKNIDSSSFGYLYHVLFFLKINMLGLIQRRQQNQGTYVMIITNIYSSNSKKQTKRWGYWGWFGSQSITQKVWKRNTNTDNKNLPSNFMHHSDNAKQINSYLKWNIINVQISFSNFHPTLNNHMLLWSPSRSNWKGFISEY